MKWLQYFTNVAAVATGPYLVEFFNDIPDYRLTGTIAAYMAVGAASALPGCIWGRKRG